MGAVTSCCDGNESSDYKALRNTYTKPRTLEEMTSAENVFYGKCVDLTNSMSKSIIPPTVIQHDDDHANTWKYIGQIAQVCQDPLNDFSQRLVAAIESFPTDSADDYHNGYEDTQVIKASLKDEKSATKQVKMYDGNWLRVVDVCNAKIIHNNFQDLYFILLMLAKYNANCCGFELISIKQTYKNGTDQEWPDISVLVKPVQYKFDDDDDDKFDETEKKEARLVERSECTREVEHILETLKMNISTSQEADEEEEEEEFLNLPGHVCEIQLIHRAMWHF